MKKQYKSPVIVIESFQLDAAVAACDFQLTLNDINTCAANDTNKTYADWDICDFTASTEGENDTPCYHALTYVLINS